MTLPLLVQALYRQPITRPPVWFMRQAGRYLPEYRAIRQTFPNFMTFCLTPDAATEVTLQPITRFGLDAAIIFSDILTIPHALGHMVTFSEGYGPRVDPLTHPDQLQNMRKRVPDILDVLAPVGQTIQLTRAALSADKAVIGFCGAPFTLASYLFDNKPSQGIPNLTRFVTEHPTAFNQLLDILVDACATYVVMQIKAGADAVQIFDSWAGSCPTNHWEAFVRQPLLALSNAIKKQYPQTPVILFPRLASKTQLESLTHEAKGVFNGLSLSTETDLAWASRTLQPHVAIQGNIDPQVFVGDDTRAVRQAVQSCLDTAAPKPGYVVNLGHGFTPQTNPLSVQLAVDMIKNYQQQ